MTIVTSGGKYTDIDALACAIAYAKLLNLQNKKATAIVPGPLNSTISDTIKNWSLEYQVAVPKVIEEIVIVDISEPELLESWVDLDKVSKIFDHHYGHEKFWSQRLVEESHIQAVGACATQIWEEWVKSGIQNQIDATTANLLSVAIVSNTLNFNATVTTDRDRKAYAMLQEYTNLPNTWIEEYYKQVEASMIENPSLSIVQDTKVVGLPNLNLELVIGQLELWNAKEFIQKNQQIIIDTLGRQGEYWLMTMPSISEGKNYLYSQSDRVKKLLSQTMQAKFDGDKGYTNKLFLRKELLRELQKISVT